MIEGNVIFHMTDSALWQKSLEHGEYVCPSLEQEGFIHFSLADQVVSTANRHYHGVTGLVLLKVAINRLSARLKYEAVPGGETYPHLYGPLNLDAVEKVYEFSPAPNGDFIEMPDKSL